MFTRVEFDELKLSTKEALDFKKREVTLVRKDTTDSENIDTLYNEGKYAKTLKFTLKCPVNEVPEEKVLSKFGLDNKGTVQLQVPKAYLDQNGIEVKNTDTFKLNAGTDDERVYVIKKLLKDGEFPILEPDDTTTVDYLSLVVFGSMTND